MPKRLKIKDKWSMLYGVANVGKATVNVCDKLKCALCNRCVKVNKKVRNMYIVIHLISI